MQKKSLLGIATLLMAGSQLVANDLDDAYKRAAETVKTAKTAAELDAVIEELKSVSEKNQKIQGASAVSGTKEMTVDQLDGARNFVEYWQEYLAAKNGGYEDKAREIAGNLKNYPVLLLPRSELLAREYVSGSEAPKIQVECSSGADGEKPSSVSPVIVDIRQDGQVAIGDSAPIEVEKLESQLAPIKASNPGISVFLRVHKGQSFQQVCEATDAIKRAGVSKVAIVRDMERAKPTVHLPPAQ